VVLNPFLGVRTPLKICTSSRTPWNLTTSSRTSFHLVMYRIVDLQRCRSIVLLHINFSLQLLISSQSFYVALRYNMNAWATFQLNLSYLILSWPWLADPQGSADHRLINTGLFDLVTRYSILIDCLKSTVYFITLKEFIVFCYVCDSQPFEHRNHFEKCCDLALNFFINSLIVIKCAAWAQKVAM